MSAWHWPQWVVAVNMVFGLSFRPMNRARREGIYAGFILFSIEALGLWVLWMGGFWQ